MWSARVAPKWIGRAGALCEPDGRVQLVSMWPDLGWRRQAVARALIAAVLPWLRQGGGSELFLWVCADSHTARRCYATVGFQLTGPVSHSPPIRSGTAWRCGTRDPLPNS